MKGLSVVPQEAETSPKDRRATVVVCHGDPAPPRHLPVCDWRVGVVPQTRAIGAHRVVPRLLSQYLRSSERDARYVRWRYTN